MKQYRIVGAAYNTQTGKHIVLPAEPIVANNDTLAGTLAAARITHLYPPSHGWQVNYSVIGADMDNPTNGVRDLAQMLRSIVERGRK